MTITAGTRMDRMIDWSRRLASGAIPESVKALSPMPLSVLEYGLSRTIEGWRRDQDRWTLLAAGSREGGAVLDVVLPSNSPAPLLNVLAAAWLRGAKVRFLPSRTDRAFVVALTDWTRLMLDEISIEVADSLGSSCDMRIVFGSDETVAKIERASPEMAFDGHGHRWSVAISLEPPGVAVVKAGIDIITWNQNGCLSPLVLLVPRTQIDVWKQALADQLVLHEAVSPRGSAPAATLMAIHTARMDARARGGEVLAPEEGTAWSVLVERSLKVEPTPGARTIRLVPFDKIDDAWAAIEIHERELEAVGVAAPDEEFEQIRLRSGTRPGWIVRLGEMQAPPLLRFHGRRPPLAERIPLRSSLPL